MRLSESPDAPLLIAADVPQPRPQRGELLVRVHAAGVTPTELLWLPTTQDKDGGTRRHAIPGHEFSGVVAGVGDDTVGVAVGDEVFGLNDWFADGAMAEYCVTLPSSVGRKPARLSHVEAASVPIGALTAWQGLFDRATLQAGERVLVHGGAGAVGLFAIQLARWRGAHVTTTVSPRNAEFVRMLGAEQVIDYRAAAFEEQVSAMDVVFDTVGGDTLARSWSVLRPGGRMITIAAEHETTTDDRIKQAYFIVEPNREQLERVGAMLASGDLRPEVDAVLPLAQASAAFSRDVPASRGRGKIVVSITER